MAKSAVGKSMINSGGDKVGGMGSGGGAEHDYTSSGGRSTGGANARGAGENQYGMHGGPGRAARRYTGTSMDEAQSMPTPQGANGKVSRYNAGDPAKGTPEGY